MPPIFETSLLGFKVSVFENHISYKKLFGIGGETSIPINQISSIDIGLPGLQQISIETTGGKKINIPVSLKSKNKLIDAIHKVQSLLK